METAASADDHAVDHGRRVVAAPAKPRRLSQANQVLVPTRLPANAGFDGIEVEWLDSLRGEDGLSAYEIELEEGFVGTMNEWVDSWQGR